MFVTDGSFTYIVRYVKFHDEILKFSSYASMSYERSPIQRKLKVVPLIWKTYLLKLPTDTKFNCILKMKGTTCFSDPFRVFTSDKRTKLRQFTHDIHYVWVK